MSLSLERQTAALVEAGMALASELDLDSLLQRIADLAREVVGADYAAVGVLGDRGELARFVWSGLDAGTAKKIGDLPQGVGVLGALIEEGRPLRLREISDHPRSSGFPDHHPPTHSFLGVPIVAITVSTSGSSRGDVIHAARDRPFPELRRAGRPRSQLPARHPRARSPTHD